MFFAIRRVIQVLMVVLALASFGYLYYLGAFEPFVIAGEVLMNREKAQPTDHLTGRVIQVSNATSFLLTTDDQTLYSFRLAGILEPAESQPVSRGEFEEARSFLSDLILSNRVDLVVTFLNESRVGLGIAYLGSTNVNAEVIRSGHGKLVRKFIKPFPFLEQYRLIAAERAALDKDRR